MKSLEIINGADVPGAQLVDGSHTVVIDYQIVTDVIETAYKLSESTADPDVKKLADMTALLGASVTQIVSGLSHGRVAVFNYPSEGAHLE